MPGDVPSYDTMLWPTLVMVSELGGSGSISEISEAVIGRQAYGEQVQSVLHKDGPQTEIEYRLAWARSHLKAIDLLDNSARGVWSLTEAGAALVLAGVPVGPEQVHTLWREANRERNRQRAQARADQVITGAAPGTAADAMDEAVDEPEVSWRDTLLDSLMAMEPAAFERLAQRLLREADFISVNVTGRTGDGGIDGVGVYRLSLLSFPVFFQCKRYRGSVGSGSVRDFRGAMAGRGDKGLLITTGTFTADAKSEATRDGAPPVDLIDGLALSDLLKQYDLGVRTTVRQVEDVVVEETFFRQL